MLPSALLKQISIAGQGSTRRGALELSASSPGRHPKSAFTRFVAHRPCPAISVDEIAKKKGVSMAQVAIAWSLSKDVITAPIVGTTKLQNLKEAIGT